MIGRLVVVSGTGTEIGKTHLAEALVTSLGQIVPRVVGLKPIESGVTDAIRSDAARLAAASTFHVKPFGHAFPEAVSPHLAARHAGVRIDLAQVARHVHAAQQEADAVLVELPGGLFSPVTDTALNADLLIDLAPDTLVLVVSDRLGALHDAIACLRACAPLGLLPHEIVFSAPALADPSTGHNAEEFQRLTEIASVVTLPRLDVTAAARLGAITALAARAATRSRSARPA